MDWFDIQTEALELGDKVIKGCTVTEAKALGLDQRCGMLYVGEDFIACHKDQAHRLEYYGGFEYVDKEHKMEVADLVLYSSQSARVQEHLDNSAENT